MHGVNVVIVVNTEYQELLIFNADSIKLATVVECDAEEDFAFAFTVCGWAAIPKFLRDWSPCSVIPNC